MAANRARVVLEQPGDDAAAMVQVLARHLPRLRAGLEFVRADWTVWIIAEMPAAYLHHRHWVDCRLRSRRWPLTVASLQQQLLKHSFNAGTGKEATEVWSIGANSATSPDANVYTAVFARVSRHVAAKYQPRAQRGLPSSFSAYPSCTWVKHRIAAHLCHPLTQNGRHSLHHSKSSILAIIEAWAKDTVRVQRASCLTDLLDKAIIAIGADYILSTKTNWPTAGIAPMCGSIWHLLSATN
jgi:hypothetical protein